ncbi:HAMP domain-containing sensor histidine kinase [Thalassobaculum sp. OXR-137]|uniref:sensor histidine kinase n=1 Tax=Thalassobaculum sp. OXR-137 TaxID=3100173 RepID=UPI002AC8C418|nr:HAMP domain-containing sensor histidine kinase [Thalassobaculum sp. OXR-137]WPZ35214.1 HAMP domain-containing sensor histidine kinase [Thalassobaculum sp. OXR-137]
MSADALDTERVRYLYRSPASVLASTFAAFVLAFVSIGVVGRELAVAWMAVQIAISGCRVYVWILSRSRRITVANHRRWALIYEAGLLASAVTWAVPSILLYTTPLPIDTVTLYGACVAALGAGAVFSFAIWWRSFVAYLILVIVPPVSGMLMSDQPAVQTLGVAGLPYFGAVAIWGRVVSRTLAESIALRLENYALASDLGMAREHARELDRTRHDGFASLSHELRTPLNAIIGFGQAIEAELWGPVGNKRYVEYASNIVHAGQHLDILIGQAMDLSRLESGRITLDEEEVPLAELAATCEALIAERASSQGLTLTATVDPDLPLLRCDPSKIRQIIINLLSNAVKFTQSGGRVALSIRRTADGDLDIAVSDTGFGISPEELKRVMEPFVRGDHAQVRASDGLGLGLALSRTLAELHGGSVELTSTVGEGTTAHLYLPKERLGA